MFDQQVTFLYCHDLGASTTFYEETLGLEVVLDQGGCRIYRVSADGFLGICQVREGRAVQPDGVVVTLVTDDVDGWHSRLAARGVAFETGPQAHADFNIYHCFLRDPDGYLLEIQRFEDPAWPRARDEMARP